MFQSGKSKQIFFYLLLLAAFWMQGCTTAPKAKLERNNRLFSSINTPGPDGRLPMQTDGVAQTELNHFYEMGSQFLYSGTADPYQLAEAIYRYRDQRNSIVFDRDFSNIQDVDPMLLIEIASARAPHIDLYSEHFLNADPQTQPVRALFEEIQNTSGIISMIAYGDDVRKTANTLFEGHSFDDGNGYLVRYDQESDLYYLPSSPTLVTEYPIILSADPLDGGGWNVRAVVLSYWDSYNTWACPDGSWKSEEGSSIQQVVEFVTKNLKTLPQYLYTLLPSDSGELRLDGFEKL